MISDPTLALIRAQLGFRICRAYASFSPCFKTWMTAMGNKNLYKLGLSCAKLSQYCLKFGPIYVQDLFSQKSVGLKFIDSNQIKLDCCDDLIRINNFDIRVPLFDEILITL